MKFSQLQFPIALGFIGVGIFLVITGRWFLGLPSISVGAKVLSDALEKSQSPEATENE